MELSPGLGNGELLMMAAAGESLILSRKSVLSDFLRPPLATPIQLAHSINNGGGRVRTLSKG